MPMLKASCEIFTSKMNDWFFHEMMASVILCVVALHCVTMMFDVCGGFRCVIIRCCIKTDDISFWLCTG